MYLIDRHELYDKPTRSRRSRSDFSCKRSDQRRTQFPLGVVRATYRQGRFFRPFDFFFFRVLWCSLRHFIQCSNWEKQRRGVQFIGSKITFQVFNFSTLISGGLCTPHPHMSLNFFKYYVYTFIVRIQIKFMWLNMDLFMSLRLVFF